MHHSDPDIRLDEFSLWIFGRQFPASEDYWDGNWLNVKAEVRASDATVRASGAILHLGELADFAKELERLDQTVAGSARLNCIEPNLKIVIEGNRLGHLKATIDITPDHMYQRHTFISEFDQTFLKPLLAQVRGVLSRYPLKAVADR
jgi:hypothetical protein